MSNNITEETFEYDGTDLTPLEAIGSVYSQMMAHSEDLKDHYWEKAFESYENAAKEFLFTGRGRHDNEEISEDFAEMFQNYSQIRTLNQLEEGNLEGRTLEEEGETAEYVEEDYEDMADVIQPDKWLQLFVTGQGGKIGSEERFREVVSQTMESLEKEYDSFENAIDIAKASEKFDFGF